MAGESGTGKHGEKHHYYICTKRKREHACNKKTVRKDWLESLVVDETVCHILQPDKIDTIARRCVEIHNKERDDSNEIAFLEKRLTETKKSIENMMNAIEQGIITKNTKVRLSELEAAQEQLEYEIGLAKVKIPTLTEKQVRYMISQFQRETTERLDEYNSNLIECFVNSVHLFDDKIITTYNLQKNERAELESSTLQLLSDLVNPDEMGIYTGSDLTLCGGDEGN